MKAIFKETSKGLLCFVQDDNRYYVGIADGMNKQIDINHTIAGGVELPYLAGVEIFGESHGLHEGV